MVFLKLKNLEARKKESNFIGLAYIADVSVLTNPVIYANIVFRGFNCDPIKKNLFVNLRIHF